MAASLSLSGCSKFGKIEGEVVNKLNGQAISGASVAIRGTSNETHSDERGRFFLSGIVPGAQRVSVSSAGYISLSDLDVLVAKGVTINAEKLVLVPEPPGPGLWAVYDGRVNSIGARVIPRPYLRPDGGYTIRPDALNSALTSENVKIDFLLYGGHGASGAPFVELLPLQAVGDYWLSKTPVQSDWRIEKLAPELWRITGAPLPGRYGLRVKGVDERLFALSVITQAEQYWSLGTFFAKQGNWDEALKNFVKGRQTDPRDPKTIVNWYFTGNVFNDRFDMNRQYKPEWGDQGNAARDDYERGLEAYAAVEALDRNYQRTIHQEGVLHLKRAQVAHDQDPKGAEEYESLAIAAFIKAIKLGPEFDQNYLRLGQIYMIQKRYLEAVKVYEALLKAIKSGRSPAGKSNLAEAHMNLGNAYFMMERWRDAEKGYRDALSVAPGHERAKKNLEVLRQKMASGVSRPR